MRCSFRAVKANGAKYQHAKYDSIAKARNLLDGSNHSSSRIVVQAVRTYREVFFDSRYIVEQVL